ncbi:MAG TPA: dual specificity protein phosphatase [Chloroflexota bacterium]
MSEPASGPGTLPPLPYPSDRAAIAESFRQPLGRLWLRILARLMEWLTDLQPKQLNYSAVTPQLAVGGAFKTRQIKRLRQRGITAVVDCRLEAQDNVDALKQAGIEFLHLPTLDRHGFTFEQMRQGVEWVLAHLEGGGRAFLHCEHGVGRGPLMTCAVLVGQGYGAPEALRMVRAARWQALPNDRQLAALLGFEQAWRQQRSEPIVDDASTLDHAPDTARLP